MDRGAWPATVHGIAKESDMTEQLSTYIKWINNKDLLHSTENYIQYLIITCNGKESEKEHIYIYIYIFRYTYITESLCRTPETNTTL